VLAANPELASMRAMVEMAVAQVDVARQARTPDYTGGLSVDVKPTRCFTGRPRR